LSVLETDRLTLDRLSTADAAFIVERLNEPSFLRHIGDKGVRTEADACRYLEAGPEKEAEVRLFARDLRG
jgi:hypothetical protein